MRMNQYHRLSYNIRHSIGGENELSSRYKYHSRIFAGSRKIKRSRNIFREIESQVLFLSEFSLYSLGIICNKRKKDEAFQLFLTDAIITSIIRVLILDKNDYADLMIALKRFRLDFDDAYQYTLGKKFNLQIISYDFDRTDCHRMTPADVLFSLDC